AAPALLTLFIARFVPESRRWEESVKAGNARPLREIFTPPLLRSTLLAIGFASIVLVGTWGSVQWLPAWADQLTQGRNHNAKGVTQMLCGLGAVLGCFIGSPGGGARGGGA